MEDEILLGNFKIGMWSVQHNGITYVQASGKEYLIHSSDLHCIKIVDDKEIWDYAIHLAGRTWCTQSCIEDYLKAMSINRLLNPIQLTTEIINRIDTNTFSLAIEIIKDDGKFMDL